MSKKRPPIHAKNRQMNSAIDYLYRKVDQITPQVYAAFAVVLTERGWEPEEIAKLFAETQTAWAESGERDVDIVTYCSETLGIEVRAGKQEE